MSTRRQFLGGAAAATLAGAPALSAEPHADPALDVIVRHQQAYADHIASINATDSTEPHTDARREANDRQMEACDREIDLAWELAATIPTTAAGIAAVLEYVNQFEIAHEEWPNIHYCVGPMSWHFKLRQSIAQASARLASVS
ncbi:twin-arginine translocation signal domain-containing protein [Bradyrhizobium viridifuturi]|uniref:twin-arginine translocation signal domain-containing protein n=1 Tax=Bradyrhizobium viridifuturi TaxID=1654716 RepID=UPI00067E711E|nr:twin-arginine translocation signal domain-containing protein [Bradyrhizobium viridifuturi]